MNSEIKTVEEILKEIYDEKKHLNNPPSYLNLVKNYLELGMIET